LFRGPTERGITSRVRLLMTVARDVSRPARAAALPFRALVRTALGDYWALQAWRVVPPGPEQLRFSRWHGAPPMITGAFDPTTNPLEGTFSYHGRPLVGSWMTPEGKRVRVIAYIEAQMTGGWRRLLGVSPRRDGLFTVFIRPAWRAASYRLVGVGPTIGKWRLPDVAATVPGA
jgi:hypothetical protein